MTITALYKEITTALENKRIPYMVSGSIAMIAYTVARTTRGIDIVVELSEDLLSAFYEMLYGK